MEAWKGDFGGVSKMEGHLEAMLEIDFFAPNLQILE
jgi:hypothetical protein